MYSWVSHTWNPIRGSCPHECGYCYVEDQKRKPVIRNKYTGPPLLAEGEMNTNLGSGNSIFVSNMADLFAEGVHYGVISAVLSKCRRHQNNTYLFQSKNPKRFFQFIDDFPEKSIFCTTIESNRNYSDTKAPGIEERVKRISHLRQHFQNDEEKKVFVTIEPIMDFDLKELFTDIWAIRPEQVSIGADSQKSRLPEPTPEKVRDLIAELETFTRVHQKENLGRLLK